MRPSWLRLFTHAMLVFHWLRLTPTFCLFCIGHGLHTCNVCFPVVTVDVSVNYIRQVHRRSIYYNRNQSGATTPGQSEPRNNGNEEVLHILQIQKARASLSDRLTSYLGYLLRAEVLLHCWDAVSVFYSHNWLVWRFRN